MAGLLDLFSGDDARLGLSLLAAAGPSMQPIGFGQRLQGAMSSFDDYKKDQLKTKLADLQMQTGMLGLTKAQQEAQDDASARQVMQNFYSGNGVVAGNRPAGGGATGAVNAGLPSNLQIGALPATPQFQQQGVQPKVDVYSQYKALSQDFAAKGLAAKAQQYAELAEKYRPKYSTTPQQMVVGGKLTNVLVGEDGTTKTLDGFDVKPDMVEQDLGDKKVWVNKNALTPGQSFAKAMTPGEVASNSTALRGQNLTDARAREQLAQGRVPTGYRQTVDGGLEFVPGGPADPAAAKRAAPTEFQGKSTTFAARMQDAARTIDSLQDQVTPASVARAGYKPQLPGWLPGGQILGAGIAAANRETTPEKAQLFRQAQENWVTANLRQESGAAIGKDEMEKDIAKWFPQPGEPKSLIEQKAAARKVAERAMVVQSGPGATSIPSIVGDSPMTSAGAAPASSGVHWRYENGKLVKVQ